MSIVDQEAQKKVVRDAVFDIYAVRRSLERGIPESRERDITLLKLDEAIMWIKGIPYETAWQRKGKPTRMTHTIELHTVDGETEFSWTEDY